MRVIIIIVYCDLIDEHQTPHRRHCGHGDNGQRFNSQPLRSCTLICVVNVNFECIYSGYNHTPTRPHCSLAPMTTTLLDCYSPAKTRNFTAQMPCMYSSGVLICQSIYPLKSFTHRLIARAQEGTTASVVANYGNGHNCLMAEERGRATQ